MGLESCYGTGKPEIFRSSPPRIPSFGRNLKIARIPTIARIPWRSCPRSLSQATFPGCSPERTAFESMPSATCKNLSWCFVGLFLIAAGCSQNPSVNSELDSRSEKDILVGQLIGKSSNDASEDGVQFLSKGKQSTANRSFVPSPPPRSNSNGIDDRRPPILAIQLPDHTLFGVPIGLFSNQTVVMRKDGSIQRIKNSDIIRQSVLAERFQSMDRNELAQQLRAEFGRNYTIRSENPYLIVARPEHIEAWTQRFRSLHHSFKLYCTTHAIPTREIEFPLVAVVFGSQNEFLRYANSEGTKVPKYCVGYYFSDSNRILLYESPDSSMKETQATISHEATHQLAFNMGLHQRRASTPLWIIEGLATMFESPMLTAPHSRQGKSLWPASRQSTWQVLSKHPETLQSIVAGLIHNDLAFEADFQNAYTVAWAMTSYLSQRRSLQFGPYLQRVGNKTPFQEYKATDRVAEFESAFGIDSRLLTSKIIKYLETLE